MDAQIIIFRGSTVAETTENETDEGPRTCDRCIHCASSSMGEYCFLYEETLMSVHEADDCPDFELP